MLFHDTQRGPVALCNRSPFVSRLLHRVVLFSHFFVNKNHKSCIAMEKQVCYNRTDDGVVFEKKGFSGHCHPGKGFSGGMHSLSVF